MKDVVVGLYSSISLPAQRRLELSEFTNINYTNSVILTLSFLLNFESYNDDFFYFTKIVVGLYSSISLPAQRLSEFTNINYTSSMMYTHVAILVELRIIYR